MIIYQKELEKNEVINKKKRIGTPLSKITALEAEIGRTFPLSYKEFLLLAGDYDPMSQEHIMDFDSLLYLQETIQEQLELYHQTLQGDYWVFNGLQGEQFSLFYWNSGEDPAIYTCRPAYVQDGIPLIEKFTDTFTDFVNRGIAYFK